MFRIYSLYGLINKNTMLYQFFTSYTRKQTYNVHNTTCCVVNKKYIYTIYWVCYEHRYIMYIKYNAAEVSEEQ